MLRNVQPITHRKEGQNLNLQGETVTKAGSFAAGNGWQEVKFDAPVSGRYICIEAVNAQDGKDNACIAEWYMLDDKGQRISREPWTISYANSEEVRNGNRAADKMYDLQESTYWSTARGDAFPHTIVLDLGSEQNLSGFKYLQRMEQGATGRIKDFKINVKKSTIKY